MFGMICSVNAQFTNYTTGNSILPSDYVVGGVVIDTSNNVWVGTDAGVAKFDGTNWTVYTTADGLPVDIISCIAVDKTNNNIWIGTEGDGVARYDGVSWTTYTNADGLCDNGIHAIASENTGDIWFGSWGAGLSKLSGSTWTTYTDADGLPSDAGAIASIYYIYIDGMNNKWFGTDLGLVKYNSTFSTYNQTTITQLKSNIITSIAVDAGNNRWLGVSANGIAKLNSSDAWVANYDTTNGICDPGVQDIEIDAEGNIWLGEFTKYGSLIEGGITKFNAATGTGVSFSEPDGLVDDQVFSIAADQNNVLWIATGAGLSKYVDQSGISENIKDLNINIYPNPVQQVLNINGYVRSGSVVLSDVTGRVFLNEVISVPATIDTEKLDSGVYFMKITDGEKVFYGKFIKE